VGLGLLFYEAHSDLDPPTFIMSAKPLSAFVLGGSGTAGKGIVKALIDNPNYNKVGIIGRRKLEFPNSADNPNFAKVEQKVIDFDDASTYAEAFKGYDVGFCALGIASAGISNEAYFKITHDYVVNTAKLALAGGCKHYHFISGQGTSKTSWFNWARVKAQVEEEISAMGFDRLSIYRPAGIIKDCNEATTKAEHAGILAFKILDPFKLMSVHSLVLGQVIANNTFRVVEAKSETLSNGDILKLAKEFNVK